MNRTSLCLSFVDGVPSTRDPGPLTQSRPVSHSRRDFEDPRGIVLFPVGPESGSGLGPEDGPLYGVPHRDPLSCRSRSRSTLQDGETRTVRGFGEGTRRGRKKDPGVDRKELLHGSWGHSGGDPDLFMGSDPTLHRPVPSFRHFFTFLNPGSRRCTVETPDPSTKTRKRGRVLTPIFGWCVRQHSRSPHGPDIAEVPSIYDTFLIPTSLSSPKHFRKYLNHESRFLLRTSSTK